MPSETQRYDVRLLDRHVACQAGARVLELGYFDTAGALWAARRAAAVVALRPAIDLATELDQVRRVEGLATLDCRLAVDVEAAERGTFDAALLLAPFFLGNAAVHNAIRACASALRSEGALYMQVHRRHGGETFARFAAGAFARVDLLGLGRGQHRLYRACEPRPRTLGDALPSIEVEPVDVPLRGVVLRLRFGTGVFASRGVDTGSRLLIDTVAVPPGGSILDLGCGMGVVGLALAARDRQARVVLVDNSRPAVELARTNAALNALANVDVRIGDAYDAVAADRFDRIVSNLPAHRGHVLDRTTADRFISDASEHLLPGGEAWFVANAALPYESVAGRSFGRVERVAAARGFKVLRCAAPRAAPRPSS